MLQCGAGVLAVLRAADFLVMYRPNVTQITFCTSW